MLFQCFALELRQAAAQGQQPHGVERAVPLLVQGLQFQLGRGVDVRFKADHTASRTPAPQKERRHAGRDQKAPQVLRAVDQIVGQERVVAVHVLDRAGV